MMAQVHTQSSSLSSLCSICHTNTPRYKCPRCLTRTCSLSCSTLHKTRALCSGVRDPATYATKRQLNAPAAFDRDYNFISGVERGIERANRDSECRGITRSNAAPGGAGPGENGPKRGEVPLRKSLEEDGIRVLRAPRGMKVAEANKTHWRRKGGGVVWTVGWRVWAREEGAEKEKKPEVVRLPEVFSQCHENISLGQAWSEYAKSNQGAVTRKHRHTAFGKELQRVHDREPRRMTDERVETETVSAEATTTTDATVTMKSDETEVPVDSKKDTSDPCFYLEAPDRDKPGKRALLRVGGPNCGFRLRDIFASKTFREIPQFDVWLQGSSAGEDFSVFEEPIHVAAERRKGDPAGGNKRKADDISPQEALEPSDVGREEGSKAPRLDAPESQETPTPNLQPDVSVKSGTTESREELHVPSVQPASPELPELSDSMVGGQEQGTRSERTVPCKSLGGLSGLDYSSD